MKKNNMTYVVSVLLIIALSITFSSCKKDEPFVKPVLSFSQTNLTYKESDGEVEIELKLDKAYSKDIEIDYKLSGTAGEEVAVGANVAPDYKITSDYLKATIKAGETTGIIKIKFYSDFEIEQDETIKIEIQSVNSDQIEVPFDKDALDITLKQEDGLVVVLEWGVGTGENYIDVDMDLFLWAEDNTATLAYTAFGSSQATTQSPEFMFLPTALLDDGAYGLSCNYYSGTVEPMNFQVRYISWINNASASTVTKKGVYTLANINAWDATKVDPALVMTFAKLGAQFKDFSDITIPTAGSRVMSGKIPKELKRTQAKNSVDFDFIKK